MGKSLIYKIIILILSSCWVTAQNYNFADPFYLLRNEFSNNNDSTYLNNNIRPYFLSNNKRFSLRYRSEFYLNDGHSNQENMDVRYIGKGSGFYNSLNFSFYNNYLAASIEPYVLSSSNIFYDFPDRPVPYTVLNDFGKNVGESYLDKNFKELQLYIHFRGVGIGYSNANMWVGPGIHSSLTMTNNTRGFNNYSIGTLREIVYKKIGFQAKLISGDLSPNISGYKKIYYSSLVTSISLKYNPIITIGFNRNYLSGGVDIGRKWSKIDAAKLVLENLFVDKKGSLDYTQGDGHDSWDQTLVGFFEIFYPDKKFKIYAELGANDHRQNLFDLRSHPDHAIASILGFRGKGIFGNDDIVFGLEYTNIILGRHWRFRITPNWYERSYYNDFSYDGRRWAAHSGSDSDDLYIFLGYQTNKYSLIPAINYERHGVNKSLPPEVKIEFRLNFSYQFKRNYKFNVFYENEYLENIGFTTPARNVFENKPPMGVRKSIVIWFGLEKTLNINI